MNVIIKYALIGAAKSLLGSDVWEKIRKGVDAMSSSSDLSGEEKRALLKTSLQQMGVDALGFLINLGIEIAVALLDSKVKDWEAEG